LIVCIIIPSLYHFTGGDSTTHPCVSGVGHIVNDQCVNSGFYNYFNSGVGSLTQLQASFGFFPASSLLVSSNVPGRSFFSQINSYVNFSSKFSGVPNFLAKLAPVASHINIQKFRELGKDFYNQQIFDLLQFGFLLDLDKSNFLPNLAVVNHGSALPKFIC
jgi:hypothetical protein